MIRAPRRRLNGATMSTTNVRCKCPNWAEHHANGGCDPAGEGTRQALKDAIDLAIAIQGNVAEITAESARSASHKTRAYGGLTRLADHLRAAVDALDGAGRSPRTSAPGGRSPMTQPDTLHDRIRAELDRRLAVARAATPGPWHWGPIDMTKSGKLALYCALQKPFTPGMWPGGSVVLKAAEADIYPSTADAEHIALHDPADAVRRYEGELEVLERHGRTYDARYGDVCKGCNNSAVAWPCRELTSLAHRLGVNVDG